MLWRVNLQKQPVHSRIDIVDNAGIQGAFVTIPLDGGEGTFGPVRGWRSIVRSDVRAFKFRG